MNLGRPTAAAQRRLACAVTMWMAAWWTGGGCSAPAPDEPRANPSAAEPDASPRGRASATDDAAQPQSVAEPSPVPAEPSADAPSSSTSREGSTTEASPAAIVAAPEIDASAAGATDDGAAPAYDPGSIRSEPFAASSAPDGATLFTAMDPQAIGIDFFHAWTKCPGQLRNNTTGCGVCLGDYDGDGRVDVYLPRSTDGGRLYRNLGDWKFEDVTERAGIGGADRWTTGATFADVDNDGDLDLYVCGFDCPNHLYLNRGDGTFEERGAAAGVDHRGASAMMAFADYDGDGDLDGYLLTNHIPPAQEIEYDIRFDRRGVPQVPVALREYHDLIRLPDGTYGVIEVGQFDRLFRNRGDGTFENVTAEAGVDGNHKGLSVTWWDYDDDGLPDIYVANDFYGQDILYRNQGDGTFKDVAPTVLPHTPWFSMGADLGDVNNDGLFDFMGTDMAAMSHYRMNVTMGDIQDEGWFLEMTTPRQYMRNAVYLGTGLNRVHEAAYLMGLAATNWTWSARFVDLDQDGRVDLHVTNGMSRDWGNSDLKAEGLKRGPLNSDAYNGFWDDQPPLKEANFAFRNAGNLQFENVGAAWGLDHVGVSFGAAFGDLDGDGDLDLIVNNFDEIVSVYRNDQRSGGAICLRLEGRQSNRWGVGAKVLLRIGDQLQARYLTLSRGFMSASEPTVHFGVGNAERIDELEVRWPSGQVQTFRDLESNRKYTIVEPIGGPPATPAPRPQAWFAASDELFGVEHAEQPFDDFAAQPLLPWRLSQWGPGLAVGDANGDGHDDLFVGGAAGSRGVLVLGDRQGQWEFSPDLFPAWNEHTASEDLGCLWLDVDGDGDQDLLVASGGVESPAGDEAYRDRLYLNQGNGEFAHAPQWLPDLRESTAAVAAADFDRDGDLDLFVGGRTQPGAYPRAPQSRLLVNDGTRFVDQTAQAGPEIARIGMVTSALWTDYDGDGWLDLLVTEEWGPIRLFRNDQGALRETTEAAGLADLHGWWFAAAGRDVDNDGDIDYVVTNLGRNSMYQPGAETPARLFLAELPEAERPLLLEAYYDAERRLVPLRSRHLLRPELPTLDIDFPTYHDYALATLADIVGQEALQGALERHAATAESVLLRNQGDGRFAVEPLDVAAQLAPGFGVALTDFNGDGWTDAALVQNFYGPRRETGRMDGGMGVVLQGTGDGQLRALPPAHSGLVVPGDAKGLALADLNRDGWPDLIVGVNSDAVQTFRNQRRQDVRLLQVRLAGPAGNPTAAGARVSVRRADGLVQTAEATLGGGYLSQHAATLWFGLDQVEGPVQIEVRWPDGQTSQHEISDGAEEATIAHPANAGAAAAG